MSRREAECDILRAKFTKYIEQVILHAKIDYIRKNRKKLQEIPLDDLEAEPIIDFEQQYSQGCTGRNAFSFEEKKLSRAFSELTLMRQKVLEMLFVEEMSATEIAQRMNCSLKYVYDQKYLALQKLRIALGGEKDEPI